MKQGTRKSGLLVRFLTSELKLKIREIEYLETILKNEKELNELRKRVGDINDRARRN